MAYITEIENEMVRHLHALCIEWMVINSRHTDKGGVQGKNARKRLFKFRRRMSHRVAGRSYRVLREIQLRDKGIFWVC